MKQGDSVASEIGSTASWLVDDNCKELDNTETNDFLKLTDKLLASFFVVGMFGLIVYRRLSVSY